MTGNCAYFQLSELVTATTDCGTVRRLFSPCGPMAFGRIQIAQWGTRALAWAGDLIVPPVCLACRTALSDHHALCADCWRDVSFIRAPLCDRMGIPLPFDSGDHAISAAALAHPPDYDRARAAAHFAGSARRLVHGLKYSDRQETRVLLGNWLTTAGSSLIGDAHLIIPVPMSRRRLFWRTFNQAAILALEVGRNSGLPVYTSILRRRRATRPQVGLTRRQRRDNMQGAFSVSRSRQSVIQVATVGYNGSECPARRRRHHHRGHRQLVRQGSEARRRCPRRRARTSHGCWRRANDTLTLGVSFEIGLVHDRKLWYFRCDRLLER